MLCHNRLNLTTQALRSLGEPDGFTLTILEDASDSGQRMPPLVGKNRAVYANLVSEGTGLARNAVIRASEKEFGRGDYLYLSDNDVFFKPGWLERLIQCYENAWNDGFRVLGGVGHPDHQPVTHFSYATGVDVHSVHEVHAQPLQSMLMRWEVWDKYGPFCKTEPGRVCQSEDVDFTNKIVADGGKIGVVSPALIVNTGITNSFGEKIPGWEMVQKECPPGVLCL